MRTVFFERVCARVRVRCAGYCTCLFECRVITRERVSECVLYGSILKGAAAGCTAIKFTKTLEVRGDRVSHTSHPTVDRR